MALLVAWWSLNGFLVVVDVLVALWWRVRSVLTVSVMFWVSWWCCRMVSPWYSRNDSFLTKLVRLSIPTWRQRNETRYFAIGVVCWVNYHHPQPDAFRNGNDPTVSEKTHWFAAHLAEVSLIRAWRCRHRTENERIFEDMVGAALCYYI